MLTNLAPLNSPLSRIQEIPVTFFQNIENAQIFDDNLFPDWVDSVFVGTELKAKFKTIYIKYKLIPETVERLKIIDAFTHNNRIVDLCNNHPDIKFIPLDNLDKTIQNEIKEVFSYLYNSAINHPGFTAFINDTLSDTIDRFIIDNKIQICPICGLEGYVNLKGQSRIALDHWLSKDIFPVTSVNFDNLLPIGEKCNSRPAKGNKNILHDESGNRTKVFYPYLSHHSVEAKFIYHKEPSIDPSSNSDWSFDIYPKVQSEMYLFESWNSIFNILIRYRDYVRKYILPLWENEYKSFIDESEIGHANSINELKEKFKLWKLSFKLKLTPGAIAYRSFIDNLIENCSDAYLYSLFENLKR
ncbi:MAG: hypothetical protein IBJ01_00030 [Leptospira sp.]|uniref:hypothetical protein n=1 Tax=Leptospira sp. TaxID=178 RepID=UPI0025BE0105|nr:hypothetical protein [Leptospira sp.]MBL0953137.1 hypothetical protein [Leptospira sp.]